MQVYKPVVSVILQECPGEISLGIAVAGCPYGCKDCSYKSLDKYGTVDLSLAKFEDALKKYQGLATAVVWMGGCWLKDQLTEYLVRAKSYGYKNCLYTGLNQLSDIDSSILPHLDYCKTGRWQGLPITDPQSNQKFWDVETGKDISSKFHREATTTTTI